MPRPAELVLVAYFAYASVVATVLPVAGEVKARTLVVNLGLLALYLAAVRRGRWWLRDWLPLPLMVLGYKEMGWFALPHADTRLEQAWVYWDRLVLDVWGGRALIESLGAVGPVILELAYPLVYLIGSVCLATLYVKRLTARVPEFLFCLLLGTFVSYALFPFFPSEPPRTVFPTEDLPTIQPIFRQFNYWFLGKWGIHTSVFPSAHVSSAFAAGFGLARIMGWGSRLVVFLQLLAVLIAVSTVYGRYHYLVDVLAGLVVALAAWGGTAIVYKEDGRGLFGGR